MRKHVKKMVPGKKMVPVKDKMLVLAEQFEMAYQAETESATRARCFADDHWTKFLCAILKLPGWTMESHTGRDIRLFRLDKTFADRTLFFKAEEWEFSFYAGGVSPRMEITFRAGDMRSASDYRAEKLAHLRGLSVLNACGFKGWSKDLKPVVAVVDTVRGYLSTI